MALKDEVVSRAPEMAQHALASADKVTNEYDVWITLALCVTAIIIVGIVCTTIYVVHSQKEEKMIRQVLSALLKNDQGVIKHIKHVVGQTDTKGY